MAEPGEVDVAPVEGDELALAEAGEGRGKEDRRVLLRVGGSDEGHDLLRREDLDLGLRGRPWLLDVGDRVGGQAIELARSLHDAVEDRDRLLSRAVRHLAVWVYLLGGPAFDSVRSEVFETDGAEVWKHVVTEDGVVVAQRGGLALAVLLDVAEVFVAGVGNRGAGADHPRQGAGGGFDQCLPQPGFGGALGEVAGCWPAAGRPGRTERLLYLAAVGQAVLGSPDRTALALEAEDVA